MAYTYVYCGLGIPTLPKNIYVLIYLANARLYTDKPNQTVCFLYCRKNTKATDVFILIHNLLQNCCICSHGFWITFLVFILLCFFFIGLSHFPECSIQYLEVLSKTLSNAFNINQSSAPDDEKQSSRGWLFNSHCLQIHLLRLKLHFCTFLPWVRKYTMTFFFS